MRKIIDHLSKKPEHHKRAVAFSVSFVATLFIFGVWFTTQPFFGGSEVIAEAKTSSPFAVLVDSVASAWHGVISIFR